VDWLPQEQQTRRVVTLPCQGLADARLHLDNLVQQTSVRFIVSSPGTGPTRHPSQTALSCFSKPAESHLVTAFLRSWWWKAMPDSSHLTSLIPAEFSEMSAVTAPPPRVVSVLSMLLTYVAQLLVLRSALALLMSSSCRYRLAENL